MSTGSTFGQLLRSSRLATFDPKLPQVYTSYGGFKHRRDWGLMRNLPDLKTNYITVQALDTPEHQTPFESANDKVFFVRKWHEMRLPSHISREFNAFIPNTIGNTGNQYSYLDPAFETPPAMNHIGSFSPKSFKRFRRRMMDPKKREDWFGAVSKGKVRLEDEKGVAKDLENYLRVSVEKPRPMSENAGLSYMIDMKKEYDDVNPIAKVRGRILMVISSLEIYGVSGLIVRNNSFQGRGGLAQKISSRNGGNDILLSVNSAFLDLDGRPRLEISIYEPDKEKKRVNTREANDLIISGRLSRSITAAKFSSGSLPEPRKGKGQTTIKALLNTLFDMDDTRNTNVSQVEKDLIQAAQESMEKQVKNQKPKNDEES